MEEYTFWVWVNLPSSDSQSESKLPQVKEASSDSQNRVEAASGPGRGAHCPTKASHQRSPFWITATGARVVGFVVDMYCLTMTEVADEFLRAISQLWGFLERTKGVGRVIFGWAPQAAVLAHPAVGGFVSHCGWNSILESVWCGVPMAAWPLYAEQQMNAFQMLEEVRVDYREESGVVMGAEEIAAAIERLMDGEKGVRERAEEMREKSSGAVVDGGSSRVYLARLVRDILDYASS